MPEVKGFKVKVVGDYYAIAEAGKRGTLAKPYEIEVILPTTVGALSIIKNKVLGKMLPKMFSDYRSFRTHIIESVEDLSGRTQPSSVNIMTPAQIKAYVDEKDLPVQVGTYDDLLELREAVKFAERDPVAFVAKDKARLADRMLDLTLMQLNPGLGEALIVDEQKDEDGGESTIDDLG